MKAVSLWQPWASAIPLGLKRFETRHWPTSYRGPLAIHAAARPLSVADYLWTLDGRVAQILEACAPWFERPVVARPPANQRHPRMPRGAIVATCELVDCVPIVAEADLPDHRGQTVVALDEDGLARLWEPIEVAGNHGHVGNETTETEHLFGDYTPGRYAWVLTKIRPVNPPIPAKGRQGIWDWEGEEA